MPSQTAAIPRTRRRKPMPPHLKRYLVYILVDFVFIAWNLINVALGEEVTWSMIVVAIWTAFLMLDWRRFWREWEAWRND
jgi:hypothetical protein